MPLLELPAGTGAAGSATLVVSGVFVLLVIWAAWHDVRRRRIPNKINLTLLAVGVGASVVWPLHVQGVPAALAGAGVGLALWVPFYALGYLGAGDVKFFAASSSWLGVSLAWRGALAAAVVGGVLALAFLARESRVGHGVRKLALIPFLRVVPLTRVEEMSEAEARRQLPYGVPMAIGVIVAFLTPGLVGG